MLHVREGGREQMGALLETARAGHHGGSGAGSTEPEKILLQEDAPHPCGSDRKATAVQYIRQRRGNKLVKVYRLM